MIGSPPHAWGILHFTCRVINVSRITPTCVGNTRHLSASRLRRRDHPHMRGEYRIGSCSRIKHTGSPPHAWGILSFQQSTRPAGRITPTCVGNTAERAASGVFQKDHPHMRGEYPPRLTLSSCLTGSPPHAWGIPPGVITRNFSIRITPTCVGNTSAIQVQHAGREDHPHMRGEYLML